MLSDDEIWSRWKFPADLSWKQSVINLARAIEREARQQALEEASSAVRELLDEVERLRADAERYRWIRDRVQWGYPSSEGSDQPDAYLTITGYGYYFGTEDEREQADAAIDAERRKENEK